MRSRTTFQLLSTAFTLAIAGCKKEPLPEPPPPVTPPSATTTSSAASVATSRLGPKEKRYGQRCAGEIVAGLHPAVPVDYLELRLDYYPQDKHEVVIAGSTGEACKGAKELSACKTALASAKPKSGGEYLVYTRGDEIGVISGRAVSGFLAPIDSPEEAAVTLVQSLADGTSTAAVLPSCEASSFTKTNEGFETTHTVELVCDEKKVTTYAIATAGETKVLKTEHIPGRKDCKMPVRGRRPDGYFLSQRDDRTTLGGHFAESAEMEAASVFAFERLHADLRSVGAPETLRTRAKRAVADEVRHAHLMEGFARRYGAACREVVVDDLAPRSVRDVALENAVEGCVFETWAALIARWQAEHAADPELRRAMKVVARDETRHAALAWDVAGALDRLLSPNERDEVRAARERALADLEETLDEPPADVRRVAGVPSAAEARALYAGYLNHVSGGGM